MSEALRLLQTYKDNKARLQLLELDYMNIDIADDIEAKSLAGKGYGVLIDKTNKVSSKVENIVIGLGLDKQHHITEREIKRDIQFFKTEILKTEILLSRLNQHDRFLIEQKFLADKEHQGWKVIARQYSIQFEKDYCLSWKTIKWKIKYKIIPYLDSLLVNNRKGE